MTALIPPIETSRSLGALVAELPARARVLERVGLDYCCKGRRSLAEAAADAGLDAVQLAAELAAVTETADVDLDAFTPVELVDHLVATHHAYLHDELPALDALAQKVASVHGVRHPELLEVAMLVTTLRSELEPHLAREEQVLFPAIGRLAAPEPSGQVVAEVTGPLRAMVTEHDTAGALLGALRTATAGYTVPADGCASYRSLYERLAALEADTFRHVHLENNVLVPAVEALLAGGSPASAAHPA